jgi:hypothetical protein
MLHQFGPLRDRVKRCKGRSRCSVQETACTRCRGEHHLGNQRPARAQNEGTHHVKSLCPGYDKTAAYPGSSGASAPAAQSRQGRCLSKRSIHHHPQEADRATCASSASRLIPVQKQRGWLSSTTRRVRSSGQPNFSIGEPRLRGRWISDEPSDVPAAGAPHATAPPALATADAGLDGSPHRCSVVSTTSSPG